LGAASEFDSSHPRHLQSRASKIHPLADTLRGVRWWRQAGAKKI